jgi:small subunit ribosomal protein S6
MLILPAEADEALVSTATERIATAAVAHGGRVNGIDRWGRRRLAYEIDHQNEGYYVVVSFEAEPAAQIEIERALNLADEVVRHKVTVLPRTRPQEEMAASPASATGGDATPQGE